ncbi:MAG: hypothetical protein AAFO07_01460 [Bacteroidota bacterium]
MRTKKILVKTLLLVLFLPILQAQDNGSPQAFSYQAIVRDADGLATSNQSVQLRMSILSGSINGNAVYIENHSVTTNEFGLVNLNIGEGNVQSGVFSRIDWGGAGPFFLQVEVDVNGGTNFSLMGTTQLLSVPYALHAETAGAISGINNIDQDTTNEIQQLSLGDDNVLTLSNGGGSVSLPTSSSNTAIYSLPAMGLSYSNASETISETSGGFAGVLTWGNNFQGAAAMMLRKPPNYAGGDVTFKIFFQTSDETAGTVEFFIRPRSYNSGDGFADASSISENPVSVSGSEGFGTLYEQQLTIPESLFQNDWWYVTIQRNSTSNTYPNDVFVYGVALEYATQ